MNKTLSKSKNTVQNRGFALISVLLIMSLLSLLAVGMLSLSSVSTRNSSVGLDRMQAEANARLALNIAIDKLQKELGPDQAVSAEASILDTAPATPVADGVLEPRWTGRWRTGDVGAATSTAPDPTTMGQQENIRDWSDDEGVEWLVSGLDPDPTVAIQANLRQNIARVTDAAGVVSNIHVERVNLDSGSYAFWVGDQGTKARVDLVNDLASIDPITSVSEGLRRLSVPSKNRVTVGTSFLSAANEADLNNSGRLAKVLDNDQLELAYRNIGAAWNVNTTLYDDFSVGTKGVISDVRRGGLRRDLTAAFEDSDQYETFVAGFRKGRIIDGTAATGGAIRGPRWDHLYGYYQQYRPFQELAYNGSSYITQSSGSTYRGIDSLDSGNIPAFHPHGPSTDSWRYEHTGSDYLTFWERDDVSKKDNGRTQLAPIIVGFHWHYGISAKPVGDGKYDFLLHVFPALVMWNPYNVEITNFRPKFEANIANASENKIAVSVVSEVGGVEESIILTDNLIENFIGFNTNDDGIKSDRYRSMGLVESVAFAPGEVRVFGAKVANDEVADGQNIPLGNEYDPTSGLIYTFKPGVSIADANNSEVRVTVNGGQIRGNVFTYILNFEGKAPWIKQNEYNRANHGQIVARKVEFFDGIEAEDEFTLANLKDLYDETNGISIPSKFYHMRGVVRTTIPETEPNSDPLQPDIGHNPTSIFHDFTPIRRVPAANFDMHILTSVFKGVSGDLDIQVVPDLSRVDPLGSGETIHRAYYGPTTKPSSGSVSGLTRFVMKDIPRLPMLSLGDFMHANLAIDAATPFFPVGGSYVSPFVSQGNVVGEITHYNNNFGAGESRNSHRVDVNYLLNETLFDSYFFSGTPSAWREDSHALSQLAGSHSYSSPVDSNGVERFKRGVYDSKGLLHPVDEVFNPSQHTSSNPRLSYLKDADLVDVRDLDKAAGKMMIEGAFNVNSTSVAAWEAVLSGLGGQDMRTWNLASRVSQTVTAAQLVAPFPRFSVPTSVQIGTNSIDPLNHPWGGLRSLNATELNDLAVAIVEEVKERGPFLSMNDFINRRLETGDNGRLGALQAAIDSTSINTTAATQGVAPAYDFNQDGSPDWAVTAGVQSTAAGIPGFLLQNDILRTLAPVLSARSDTFIVRGYGDSRDGDNVKAVAICEAVLQRTPEFVDSTVDPWVALNDASQTSTNKEFGRRFKVVSFRWLSQAEIQAL